MREALADMQDPEDKVFMGRDDFACIGSDPSIGAVLCGFDINISISLSASPLFPTNSRLQEAGQGVHLFERE
jgi:hypothetical protein